MGSPNPLADSAPTDPEDYLLVTRARSGEREALETLVGRHQTWIYNIALRMLSHPQDAEDATQEILIKALTTLSSFEGRSSFRTWLYRIVVNHVLNIRRGRRDLPNFMNDKCGLVRAANPCRCARKTRGFVKAGYVDPRNLLFARDYMRQVRDVVPVTYEAIATLDERCADIHRRHPFYEAPDLVPALRRLLESPDFRRVTDASLTIGSP